MTSLELLFTNPLFWIALAWDAVWRLIAYWKAGRNNQLGWFIALAVLNTMGLLPIVYLAFFQKSKERKKR